MKGVVIVARTAVLVLTACVVYSCATAPKAPPGAAAPPGSMTEVDWGASELLCSFTANALTVAGIKSLALLTPSPYYSVAAGIDADDQIKHCSALIDSGKFTGDQLASLYTDRGYALASKRDHDGAVASFRHAIEIDPKFEEAYVGWGLADRYLTYPLNKDGSEMALDALARFDRAIELQPDDYAAFFFRALAQPSDEAGKRKKLADLTQAISLKPNFAEALSARGEYHSERQEFALAIMDYSAAIDIQRPFPSFDVVRRGYAELLSGNCVRALADFQTAERISPGGPLNMVPMAACHLQLNQPALARTEFDAALAVEGQGFAPDEAMSLLGDLAKSRRFALRDRFRDFVLVRIETYTKIENDDFFKEAGVASMIDLLQKRAGDSLRAHKWTSGIADYSRAIALGPSLGGVDKLWQTKGLAEFAAGRTSAAIADLTEAVQHSDAITCIRAHVYLSARIYNLARVDYATCISEHQNNASALYGRGQLRLRTGDRTGGQADIAVATGIMADVSHAFQTEMQPWGNAGRTIPD